MKDIYKIKILIFVFIFVLIISIFFIPEIILIIQSIQRLKKIQLTLIDLNSKKIEIKKKLEYSKNVSEILQKNKDKELSELSTLIKMNRGYEQEIEEEKTDYYLFERKFDEMKGLINLYEKNYITSFSIINNINNFFKSHTLNDYYNNISNILLTSTIVKNESDINFIYDKIIKPFYSDVKIKDNIKYILGPPCYKASIDSGDPFIFHKKCDNIGHTIMLIKTNNTRFGGITDLSWGKRYNLKENEYNKIKTRLFNLDNQKVFLYDKNQKISRHIPPIRGDNYYFAIFGYKDLYLGYLPWESVSSFPQMFLKDNKTDKNFNDLLNQYMNNNDIKFEYQDIEVYPISLKKY